MVGADGDVEEWVQNKITKATDYLKTAYSYKTGETNEALDDKDTDTVKDIIKKLKGASKAHAGQAKQLQKDFPNSSHTLTPTWSNFTLPHWKKLYKFAKNNDMWYGPEAFFQQVIQQPEHVRPKILSDKTKSEVIQAMGKVGYHKHIQRYFREPKNMDKHSINKQYQYLKDIAMFKGIDYEKLFPHIYQDTI